MRTIGYQSYMGLNFIEMLLSYFCWLISKKRFVVDKCSGLGCIVIHNLNNQPKLFETICLPVLVGGEWKLSLC